jgi:hypothetical protein
MTGEELETYATEIAKEAHKNFCGPDHPVQHEWDMHLFTSRGYAWSLQYTGFTAEQIIDAISNLADFKKFKHPHPSKVEEYINGQS